MEEGDGGDPDGAVPAQDIFAQGGEQAEQKLTAEQRKVERERVHAAVAEDPHAGPTALAERIW